MREAARVVASLDKPLGEGNDTSFGDLVAGESPEPSEEVHVSLAEQALRHAVGGLPEKEREVIKLRYGMDGDAGPVSLEEIGKRLGVTRERVRQIEARGAGAARGASRDRVASRSRLALAWCVDSRANQSRRHRKNSSKFPSRSTVANSRVPKSVSVTPVAV